MKQLNGEMLLLARKKRRMTQSELADASGVAQAKISRVENGTKSDLSFEDASALAVSLEFPIGFFYEQEPLYRRPISVHGAAFRKKSAVSVKDQDAAIASANHYALQVRRLLQAVDLDSQYLLPQFEVADPRVAVDGEANSVDSAAEAARRIRAGWQTGDGPLINLVRYVEACGVVVVFSDFGAAAIDGLTLRPAGLKPIILLNRNRPADRIRFSLAHEFGHVVLHPYPYEEMEKEANEFAAELLMPKSGVAADLKRPLSLAYLGKLKLKWHTAMSALIFRAKSLGFINPDQATILFKQMSKCGYRMREPEEFDVPHEKTKLISDLLDVHLKDLGYTIQELSDAMRTNADEFSLMHNLDFSPSVARPKLRVVASN
ncbi:XRE family transcriptional regulator [Marinicauda sp. Alg238-R41]|uniref:XRE family transcriptional regulator n=1 Tax=Marinicauda sp. Alg238-R41 TaxID=2993447 RepID=UPI0022E3CED1|nr:XRE family transcriptional regulator [Marinicauda sp. Alg238-R41]